MALVNTINVDLSANTASLVSTSGGNSVDTLTYSQSANTVTFATRPAISISDTDFSNLINQMKIFQTAILTNFNPNQFTTAPFTGVSTNEVYVSFVNQWELIISIASAAAFVSNVCAYSTGLISLNNRTVSQTLNFSEWILVLAAFNHYEISCSNFLAA